MQAREPDYHNFSPQTPHRLPTISGIEAIRKAVQKSRPISTGLSSLDVALGSVKSQHKPPQNGLHRGQITEAFGPPGAGKTTFALQIAVNTVSHEGYQVLWLSTAFPLVPSRLHTLIRQAQPARERDSVETTTEWSPRQKDMLRRFEYIQITNLPELLALIAHPTAEFPTSDTALVVIDDLSNLISSSLPRISKAGPASTTSQVTPTQVRADHAYKQAVSRRAQVISSLASALHSFAAARNVAVLATSNAGINTKTGQRAVLRPALTSQQWDPFVGSRIALYHAFWPVKVLKDNEALSELFTGNNQSMQLRFARVLKLDGTDVSTPGVGFVITEVRLIHLYMDYSANIWHKGGLREVVNPVNPVNPVIPVNVDQAQTLPPQTKLTEHVNNIDIGLDNAAPDDSSSIASAVVEEDMPDAQRLVNRKRKALEIADSDDEAEAGSNPQAPDLDPSMRVPQPDYPGPSQGGECHQQDETLPTFQTAKNLQMSGTDSAAISDNVPAHDRRPDADNDDDDEMLLDQFEQRPVPPPFSQAAADMSDPLTPSDHGGYSP